MPCVTIKFFERIGRELTVLGLALGLCLLLPGTAAHAKAPGAPRSTAASQQEQDLAWSSLSPQQQSSLAPLASQWTGMNTGARQRWLSVAQRMPHMSASEQMRVQQRMRTWSDMPAAERGKARLNYEQAQSLTPAERSARWQAYQALTPQQRQALVQKAHASAGEAGPKKATSSSSNPNGTVNRKLKSPRPRDAGPLQDTELKSNIVPNPSTAEGAGQQVVSPTMVKSAHGATTRLIGRKPHPTLHQQAGLPKIAAGEGFVNENTLLPRKGPQAAATRPVIPNKASANSN